MITSSQTRRLGSRCSLIRSMKRPQEQTADRTSRPHRERYYPPARIRVFHHSGPQNSGIGQGGKTAFIFPKCGLVPTPVDYWICTTFQRERYRRYFMAQHRERPLFESYRELALQFPRGLAESAELPEEASGAVQSAWTQTRRAA